MTTIHGGRPTTIGKPTPLDGVDDNNFDTAEDFLKALDPMTDPWRDDPTSWIFRGQADAGWPLRAKAVRDQVEFRRFGIEGDAATWSTRKDRIDEMLKRFRRGLDETGMVIPAPSPAVAGTDGMETGSNAMPFRSAFPLMALAQHHGLPTLLLDWTRRAAVAAYFAAVPDKSAGAHVAVWALELKGLDSALAAARSNAGSLEIYQAPGGTNPNLRAQAGIFTLIWGDQDPSLEAIVAGWRKGGRKGVPRLLRFTLPLRQAPKLLRLLSYVGITGASMFPGADGVVRAMREEGSWKDEE